jgi:hypothetical protein
MGEPTVVVECDNISCRYHDRFHNCKAEKIEMKVDPFSEDETRIVCDTAVW